MTIETNRSKDNSMASTNDLSSKQFYHGTKVNLKLGDLIKPGFNSNYDKSKKAAYVYLTATLDAAVWGAELALGETR
jgi:rifampin ADP-ribosylating transferase